MTELAEKIEPKKRTLNEIVEDFRRVLHCIDDAEGELTPELEQSLTEAEGELSTKVDRCLWVAREAEAQAEVYAERAKALADRATVLKGQAKRLEKYVHGAMLTLGVKRVETPNFVATIAATQASVVVDEEEKFIAYYVDEGSKQLDGSFELIEAFKLPRFVRVKLEIDKIEVKTALKAGEQIKFARLITDNTHLRVK
jgi:hypothetical protein